MRNSSKAALITMGALGGAALGASYLLARVVSRPAKKTFEYRVQDLKSHGRWEDYDKLKKVPYTVEMSDGYVLHATYIPAATETDRFVIISHGFGDNRLGSAKYALMYHALGFNSIIYDTRGMGENKDQAITLGLRESRDLISLIIDTKKRYGHDIVLGLHGESMGAAFQVMALRYMPKVDFMICDCGFARLEDGEAGKPGVGNLLRIFLRGSAAHQAAEVRQGAHLLLPRHRGQLHPVPRVGDDVRGVQGLQGTPPFRRGGARG